MVLYGVWLGRGRGMSSGRTPKVELGGKREVWSRKGWKEEATVQEANDVMDTGVTGHTKLSGGPHPDVQPGFEPVSPWEGKKTRRTLRFRVMSA
ncbi:hypothetical protein Bbelb_162500, partial [Branchiostoma belcheri]